MITMGCNSCDASGVYGGVRCENCGGTGVEIHDPKVCEPCEVCSLVGGYCGGSKHPSCGCFDERGVPCSLEYYLNKYKR